MINSETNDCTGYWEDMIIASPAIDKAVPPPPLRVRQHWDRRGRRYVRNKRWGEQLGSAIPYAPYNNCNQQATIVFNQAGPTETLLTEPPGSNQFWQEDGGQRALPLTVELLATDRLWVGRSYH